MLKSNPFLRRASSPGGVVENNLLPVPAVPSRHPGKLAQASLSESALKVPLKPIAVRNAQPRITSIRPSRFVKASTPTSSTSSPLISADDSGLSNDTTMADFIRLFETFTQKVYMEGYLMRHQTDEKKSRTKMFVELSGSTLILWDTEATGSYVMPSYLQIQDTTTCYGHSTETNKKTKHTFTIINNAKTNMTFETSDHATMVRWVSAIRLSCFEKQRLHQLFTHKLLTTKEVEHHKTIHSAYLQVKLPGTTLWQKYWVALPDNKKKCDREKQILLFETKKSKSPVLTLSDITRVHAVYPESSQLIENGSMIRVDCTLNQREAATCWFMADKCQLTIQWLFSIYDLFKLYGRPSRLLQDSFDPLSLNFGEPIQTNGIQKLFLEVDQVTDKIDTLPVSNQEAEALFLNMITGDHHSFEPRPNGLRANSLPLITVMTADSPPAEEWPDNSSEEVPFRFARNVADSSDESDQDNEENEEEEDQDSDDEPIGRKTTVSTTTTTTSRANSTIMTASVASLADSLIPDFDFGNGFDVPKDVSAAAVAAAVVHASSSSSSTSSSFDEEYVAPKKHVRKLSMPITDASSSSKPATLFGDFSLATDFGKFLDLPLDHQRKLSLPAKLSFDSRSATPSIRSMQSQKRNNQPWEVEWNDEQQQPEEEEEQAAAKSKHPFDDDSYDSDLDGPMIPSLGDHFAPQNSLLDNYLGEQLSAKEQVEYAKATGQPLIQVSTKKQGAPQGGLVGVISQREKDKKEGNGFRVAERVNQHHQDRFEREKERRIMEQRQHQIMKHQMMLYANGYGMQMMPFMNPMANQMMMPGFPPSQMNNQYMAQVRPMYPNPMGYGYQKPSLSAPLMNRKYSTTSDELLDETNKTLFKKYPANSLHT
ncbi:hypothetical protein G6F56_006223 [Rhizopus delemar]|nr:hypothetical protein G6F56_006223 [Rhizopus delemar]